MLETFFVCFACYILLCISWFTPKAGTEELNRPLGRQFAAIALISLFLGILLSNLFGVFPY